ncbi:sugar efflux transporter for intercellular exchange-domain-containing protein [Chytriomyces sp. MP71]|nr:sugar efflux transporter for intercellular exchange-domain-containing protein [Chytriomyces sp. MP71]
MPETPAVCSGSQACAITLQYVVPTLGSLTAIGLVLAPMPAIRRAVETGSLGKLNTLPFGLMATNGIVWVFYSLYIQDWFIFVPNAFGWTVAVLYTLLLLPLSPPQARNLTIGLFVAISTMIHVAVAAVFISGISHDTGLTVLGIVANLVLVAFYGSPLSTCAQVIKEKESSSLQFPLALATVVNGVLWVSYGFALSNYFIVVPNALGVAFAVFQMILIFTFPRRNITNPSHISEEFLVT